MDNDCNEYRRCISFVSISTLLLSAVLQVSVYRDGKGVYFSIIEIALHSVV
jgi:hypothetical protein